ncbi:MAG: hypothetical protein GTO02_22575, partial [Candidatus Dadabacteria bacterium]|nr:hypothetical protein [Candidatus Dadabacteria bacterium]NIQ17065.1 hypothetical protein [Candidatus Dadabacteria bacterium]
ENIWQISNIKPIEDVGIQANLCLATNTNYCLALSPSGQVVYDNISLCGDTEQPCGFNNNLALNDFLWILQPIKK